MPTYTVYHAAMFFVGHVFYLNVCIHLKFTETIDMQEILAWTSTYPPRDKKIVWVRIWIARFLLVQHTKMGINIPDGG
jgi:hypothetical protein